MKSELLNKIKKKNYLIQSQSISSLMLKNQLNSLFLD